MLTKRRLLDQLIYLEQDVEALEWKVEQLEKKISKKTTKK